MPDFIQQMDARLEALKIIIRQQLKPIPNGLRWGYRGDQLEVQVPKKHLLDNQGEFVPPGDVERGSCENFIHLRGANPETVAIATTTLINQFKL
jgi:hypothetical protein